MKNSLKTNFIYNTIYQLLQIVVPLITTPYVSRKLGADGIGVHAYAYSIAYYFSIFILLGINNYGNRSIAMKRNNKAELSKTFWSIYKMQLFMGICVIAVYILYCCISSSVNVVSWIMLFFLMSCAVDINWCFYGLEQFKITVTRNIIIKFTSTILILFFVKNSNDIWIYSLIVVGSMLISQIALWPKIIKSIPFVHTTMNEVIVHIKPNLILFITVLANSLFKTMDKIMLGIMTDDVQVGFYESSERVLAVPIALILSLGAVMLPRMSNMVANKDNAKEALIEKSLAFSSFISSSMCFGLMAVSTVFVPFFYGVGFEECIYLYIILLPSCLFMGFASVIRTQYLIPNEMDKEYLISAFLGAGINILLNMFLIPIYASKGAAIGTLVAEVVVCISQAIFVNRKLPLRKYILESIPFILCGLVMFFIVYFLNIHLESQLFTLICKIFIGAVIYLVTLFALEKLLQIFNSKMYIPISDWVHIKKK